MKRPATPCTCGSDRPYADCCQPYHAGALAPSPEALMRSRYTAYGLQLEDYLLATWHAETRPATLDFDSGPQPKWLGLKIVAASAAREDGVATVEFIARFKMNGKAERLHEISRFVQVEGAWHYLDGCFQEG